MAQVYLSDAYGRLLLTGAMCDGWIRLEDSDDQKRGPNISTTCGNRQNFITKSRVIFASLLISMAIQS